ncbi:MAG: carboxylate--amine ligase [bacterium]|nr:carboxylate--amine ligase [bacterium]
MNESPSNATPDHPAAVVVGLDSMQGIQTARILSGFGVYIVGVAADQKHPSCRTNVCGEIRYTDTGGDALVDALIDLAATRTTKAVLFPCQDKSVLVISRNRRDLERHFHVVLPPVAVVEMLMDKLAFYEHAQRNDLSVPVTRVLRAREDAARAAEEIPFPCILKPSYRADIWNQNTKQKVFTVESREELLEQFDRCRGWADALIAQQWVEGDDASLYSCNVYIGAGGEPLVTFVARKLRQWPPGAGSSCLGEEVQDDTVRDMAHALFRTVPYRGFGYVEIKKDARSGEYFIIEPNIGRPTGRSAIAEAGGVDLVYTMYCDALGLPLPENRTQAFTGVKWVDLRHDLQSAFVYWRRGQLSLRDWASSWRGRKAHAIFSWRDPKPFLYDVKKAISLALVRRRGR